MTPKQQRFSEEYLIDLNATQAAIRAGYSAKTAQEQGARLLLNVIVQRAIAESIKARSERTQVDQDRVLKELARVAFFDPRKLFSEDGNLKALRELDDDTAAAIMGVDTIAIGNDKVGVGELKKIKLADKVQALGMCMRHLGMFTDKLSVNITDGLAERLDRAMQRHG
ncbi:MAG: terminase small subunit [Zoogloeaceae bacterium]|jgi:phage terminase small subunit|nr:terminase small subunit [Zoogloeaceae bacterium]